MKGCTESLSGETVEGFLVTKEEEVIAGAMSTVIS
jgi:hypothetical protein